MYKRALVLAVLVAYLSISMPIGSAATDGYFRNALSLGGEETRIFELINRERQKKRLRDLEWDDRLADVARSYSRKMAREGFFDHYDNDGKTVADRVSMAKVKGWSKIGENLFYCDPLDEVAAFAVRSWMGSPTHRQNILDPAWSGTGIGIAVSRDGGIYITQIFIKSST